MKLRRRVAGGVAAAFIGATALLSSTGGGATASAADEPSTPIPVATPKGQLFSYVLTTRPNKPQEVKQLRQAVRKAKGVSVKSWPQIGVVIAHSKNATFRRDVSKAAGKKLYAVGTSRTVPVSEGTPKNVRGAWATDGVDSIQKPGRDAELDGAAEDPRENEQWDMKVIKADQAHEITDGKRQTLVGILDSGIDPKHPDLAANVDRKTSINCTDAGRPMKNGWGPTTSAHGTHVAGTVAAARNDTGIVGVAPNVRMASVKVVNDDGFIYPEYAICGMIWSGQQHMDVTNNSYFVDPYYYWCDDQPNQFAAKEAVSRAVAWSTGRGVTHVAAAGNSSYDLANKTTDAESPDDRPEDQWVDREINNGCHDIPAELPGVVTVSSLQRLAADSLDTKLSGFSNRGEGVIDVTAPGSAILSTVPDNGYATYSGTSMASPHVAGVAALLKSQHPGWKPAKVLRTLRKQADDKACADITPGAACVGTDEDNSYFGDGVVDALDAVQ